MAEADGVLDAGADVDDEAVAEGTLVIAISILTRLTGGSNLNYAINSLSISEKLFQAHQKQTRGRLWSPDNADSREHSEPDT